MPEGDTIYRSARALQKAIGGRIVTAFETQLAKLASVNDQSPLVGRTVERVEAQGKWCLIYFSASASASGEEALILATHMLMSGSWHIYRTGAETGRPAEKWFMSRRNMRVAITCGEMQAVVFNVQLAEFYTARTLARNSQIPKLGPDVLSNTFSVESGVAALRERATTHPGDEIAVVLLNQRVMAGLGNVYKSEVAFAAGVNHFRRMSTITRREMEAMVDASQRYMQANVNDGARGASGEGIVTYTGNRRTTHSMTQADRTWVYGRQGQECRRCGALIEMRKQGEQVRSTYWCPQCQPWIPAEGQSADPPVGRTVKVVGRRKVGC
jgi:endonuclease-8